MEQNTNINTKPKSKRTRTIAWIVAISLIAIGAFFLWKFLSPTKTQGFFDGTTINGLNVAGMSKEQASNLIATKLNQKRDEVEIELKYEDKSWKFYGKDFEVNPDILPIIESAYTYGREGGFMEKMSTVKKIQDQGFDVEISYKYVLAGLDQKIDEVVKEINTTALEPEVIFSPDKKEMFEVSEAKAGIEVDTELLYQKIDEEFSKSSKIVVDIPTKEVLPTSTREQTLQNLQLRAKFSTSYKSSIPERKSNIKLALSKFNGMVVLPEQVVSFNETTGARTAENGYKKANVILDGVYVEGTGGGVCQASTTLYNALLKADLEIVEVNKHSLPASYVPLAFDAMVSEGYSDMKFKNNTSSNIYIKAYGNDTDCYVEIYGQPFDAGVTLQRRAEFVKVIPHPGDRIVLDTNGEYSDKVMYKGEYFRLKYPREGYQSRAYIDYFLNGEKVESKLIRDETYQAQEGIVIEGVNELGEGMTLPENTVKLIGAQKAPQTKEENVKSNIEKNNPSHLNP